MYNLHFAAKEFNMEISIVKTKTMAFQSKETSEVKFALKIQFLKKV
jgi:hypothetical protein